MFSEYICALDLGSSKIAAVLAQLKGKRVEKLFFETMPSKGIRDGSIVDSVQAINCVGSVLSNLKRHSGLNIKFIYVNISGKDILSKHSHAIIPLAERGNKIIAPSDIQTVNEQARILASSLEDEIIHKIPFSYTIDSGAKILNPLGLYSHRLEVDLYLICAKLSSVQSLTRVINQSGYEIKDLFFSGIANSAAIFNEELKKGVTVLCDIGSDITEVLIFREGLLRNIEILSLGGSNLTSDLSADLKIPFDLAEDVKRSYASVTDMDREDREILVKKDNDYKPISQKWVSDIVTAKSKLICKDITEAIKKNVSYGEINHVLVTGRTVLLDGFLETLENILGLRVKLGRILNSDISSLVSKDTNLSGQKYLNYITSLGIICEALQFIYSDRLSNKVLSNNFLMKTVNKVKEIYQEYF